MKPCSRYRGGLTGTSRENQKNPTGCSQIIHLANSPMRQCLCQPANIEPTLPAIMAHIAMRLARNIASTNTTTNRVVLTPNLSLPSNIVRRRYGQQRWCLAALIAFSTIQASFRYLSGISFRHIFQAPTLTFFPMRQIGNPTLQIGSSISPCH